jgi:WD40 repeat protein
MKHGAHSSWITSLIALPNGRLMSGSHDFFIKIWALHDRLELIHEQKFSAQVQALVNLNTNRVAIGLKDRTIQVYNYENKNFEREFFSKGEAGHKDWIRTLVVVNETLLISGGDDSKLIVWDVQTRSIQESLVGHKAPIWSVAYDDLNGYLYSSSTDKNLIAWRFLKEFGKFILLKKWEANRSVYSLVVMTNGDLVSGGMGTLDIWDRAENYSLKMSKGSMSDEKVWSLDKIGAEYIVSGSSSGSDDRLMRIYSIDGNSSVIQILDKHTGQVRCVRAFPNGNLFGGSHNGEISWWHDVSGINE